MKKLSIALCLLSLTSTTAWPAETSTDYADGLALFSWAQYRFPSLFPSERSENLNLEGYVVRHYLGSDNYIGIRNGSVYGFGSAFSDFEDVGNGVRYIGPFANLKAEMSANGFQSTSGQGLVITEALAKDADGGPDWFELYASGTEAVPLNLYQIKDGNEDHEPFTLPNVLLPAGEYLRITASDAEEYSNDPYSVPFKLGSNDRVQLYKNGVLVNELDWDSGQAPEGYTFGRYPGPYSNGMLLIPTPGASNLLPQAEAIAISSLGAVGPLMSSEMHQLSFTIDPAEYDAMVNTYTSSRKKTWLEVSVTIDGEKYEHVGIRFKGNSSLMGISLSSPPATVPWLVKMDKFVDGQDHKGLEEFVIRSNNTSTSLNEAVALELLDLAGLASQDAIATAFSINGSDAVLRLVVEHLDDEWMKENFDSSGALYKAESTGDYSYRGDDPNAYEDVFDQEAGKDNADLRPLIAFLKFINESDDTLFESDLPKLLDVDSFASYLAMQDLLNNFDDIDGPGNNSYLYYDTVIEQFTIVPWDYNLAFGTLGGGGAGGGFGGGMGGMPGQFPDGEFTPPDGFTPPSPGQLPNGQPPIGGGVGAGGGFGGGMGGAPGEFPTDGGAPGGFGGGSNILVQRFLATEQWSALYDHKLVSLRQSLYGNGVAKEILAVWRDIVSSTLLVDESLIETESQAIANYFQ